MVRRAYIPMRCTTNGAVMMAQCEQSGEEWNLVKADILRGGGAHNPTAGQRVSGSFGVAWNYPGCPVCGNDSYVRCVRCGMLTCWLPTSEFRCGACGNGGPVSGAITDLNASDLG